mgnify:CR=1 FL=1|jgi:hypothetical protein
MSRSLLTFALLGALSLAACDRPTAVVAVPAAPVAVPGPAGPPGIAGAQGVDGKKGDTGKPSESTTVIITPAPEAQPAK